MESTLISYVSTQRASYESFLPALVMSVFYIIVNGRARCFYPKQ